VKPRLVLSRQRPGQAKEILPVEKPEPILKPETAIQMRQMMEGVVLHGTGSKAVLKGYTSGGKTGSAQIFDQVAHTYSHSYNASFLGFAPVGNPRIVIAVTLQGTHGGTAGYGGARAAPVFREVATGALRILEVPKDLGGPEPRHISERAVESDLASVASVDPARGFGAAIAAESSDFAHSDTPSSASHPAKAVRADVVSSVTLPLARGGTPVSAGGSVTGQRPFLKEPGENKEPQVVAQGPRVPDFRGKTLRDVLQESSAAGVPVEPSGEGLAVSQDPAPGASLSPRSPVRVSFRR
jgi:membrane peptidoglycan carboxypeptidase